MDPNEFSPRIQEEAFEERLEAKIRVLRRQMIAFSVAMAIVSIGVMLLLVCLPWPYRLPQHLMQSHDDRGRFEFSTDPATD